MSERVAAAIAVALSIGTPVIGGWVFVQAFYGA